MTAPDHLSSILRPQFGVGSLMALTMWALRLHAPPKLDEGTVRAPLCLILLCCQAMLIFRSWSRRQCQLQADVISAS